jgi:hypothetical protein
MRRLATSGPPFAMFAAHSPTWHRPGSTRNCSRRTTPAPADPVAPFSARRTTPGLYHRAAPHRALCLLATRPCRSRNCRRECAARPGSDQAPRNRAVARPLCGKTWQSTSPGNQQKARRDTGFGGHSVLSAPPAGTVFSGKVLGARWKVPALDEAHRACEKSSTANNCPPCSTTPTPIESIS